MKKKYAKLRVCAHCEWIFLLSKSNEYVDCPKCGFAHYGARYVYGNKAYRYKITQEPWVNKKIDKYFCELLMSIDGK